MTVLPVFDPRQVPVLGVDNHLPAVLPEAMVSRAIASRFSSGHRWTPELLGEPRMTDKPLAQAAVLIPLVSRPEGLTVLLTKRTSHLSSHSGQIAFPGGKVDTQDANAQATALREAEEEIGLAPDCVEVLGTFPTYTSGSAYTITPVVGLLRAGFVVKANPDEVADIFEVPLAFLMNPANHRRHAVDWAGQRREWLSMPYDDAGVERFIWGVTASMLRNFYRFLSD
jgi:8-oxo-dGTP pyrophosphatase MutT (NUDIX family)